MKSRLQLTFLILILLFSCEKNGMSKICEKDEMSKILDFQEFTIEVPADWESYSLQGIDSKVGGIKNRKNKLGFDYGWYSDDFKNETSATHKRTLTIIDGKDALIVKPIEKGNGIIGVFIQVDSQNKFSLAGRDIKNEDTAIKIFESVKFK